MCRSLAATAFRGAGEASIAAAHGRRPGLAGVDLAGSHSPGVWVRSVPWSSSPIEDAWLSGDCPGQGLSAFPAFRLEHRAHLAPTAESLKAAEALHDLPIAALFQVRSCRSEGDSQVAIRAAEDPVHRIERGLLRPIDEASMIGRRSRDLLGWVVGLPGPEPGTSSLSAKYREPLCYTPFLQVMLDRSGRSYVLSSRSVMCSPHDSGRTAGPSHILA